jgi:phosphoribosylamine--glycine ligase
MPGVVVFHAGTRLEGGRLLTAGGRVLSVTALGETLGGAVNLAYRAADRIRFDGVHRRSDIGADTMKKIG